MAVYYFLSVECGPSEDLSLNVCNYFTDKILKLTDGTKVSLQCSYGKDKIGNYWVEVIPEGVNYGSPSGSDYRLVDYFTGEITQQLYDLLKIAPHFRYALAGYEVEFFILFKELAKCLEDGCYEGMILSEELWKKFGKSDMYVPFCKGFMWYPFSELSVVGQESWFKKYSLQKEFHVNDYITLRLENGDSNVFVQDKIIIQCKHLLLNQMQSENANHFEFKSTDEIEELFVSSSESDELISIDTEFWGHCSNLQAWAENEYNTNLLDKSIAFPTLKRLTKVGDKVAKRVFKEEVRKRLKSNFLPVIIFLIHDAYHRIFSDEELRLIVDRLHEYIKTLSLEEKNRWNKQISEAFRNSIYIRSRIEGRNDDFTITQCRIALEFDEKNTHAWYELALSYQFKKNFDKAEEYYKRAISISPEDTISLGNLCEIYIQRERYQDVIDLLENNLSEDTLHSRLWFLLATVYYKLGDLNKAFKYINISYDNYPYDQKVEKLKHEISRKLT